MITLVFLGSLFLVTLLFARMRALKRRRRENTLAFKFAAHLFELSAVLASVLVFYHLLVAFLEFGGWQIVSAGTLLRLEQSLLYVQAILDHYKLSWSTSLVIMIGLYALGCLRVAVFERVAPFRRF